MRNRAPPSEIEEEEWGWSRRSKVRQRPFVLREEGKQQGLLLETDLRRRPSAALELRINSHLLCINQSQTLEIMQNFQQILN